MKILVTPDIVNYEEEFMIEAENLEEALKKTDEEMCCNCDCLIFEAKGSSLIYIGVFRFEEGKEPRFVEEEEFL